VEHLLISLLAGGHILMEDVPGVGKTTLARALSLSIEGRFSRIQFTPDLLPADVLGISIYNSANQEFEFKKGPVFTNILLADEINRASPRTQSALLQAMSESSATIDGTTYEFSAPFMVIATQNPVDFHGTYPLPEAQLDRFLLQTDLGYPNPEQEVDILFEQSETHPLERIEPVITLAQIVELQKAAATVKVEREVARYMVDLVERTRRHPSVAVGSSPRGSLALFRGSRARAMLEGRSFVLPDDVQALAPVVLSHRLMMDVKARYSGATGREVVDQLLSETPVPA
jgi:MoxR-like ATPase